ncbi:MAG: SixA phosphatase family protein [Micromonosporaceae bacterium]
MTRQLVLLRHGKAGHPSGMADIERPLTDRGERDSRAAGGWLVEQGYLPDAVVCSPAQRARQTWYGVKPTLPRQVEVIYDQRVYDAYAADELLDAVHDIDGEVNVLMLIGHNPTLEQLSVLLDPSGGPSGGLRTAGVAVHEFDGEWGALAAEAAPLVATTTARADKP